MSVRLVAAHKAVAADGRPQTAARRCCVSAGGNNTCQACGGNGQRCCGTGANPTSKPRSPRSDHAPDIGALADDHARGRADPPRIDIPVGARMRVGE